MHRSVQSAAALLLLAAGSAGSQTLPADGIVAAFDDSPPAAVAFIVDTPEPFLYKGLIWRGFNVIQSNHDSLAKFPRSGYARGAASGTFAAVAAGRAFRESTVEKYGSGAFVFYGMQVTAAWKTGLEVTVEGLRGGETAFSMGLLAGPAKTAALRGEWEIDMLRIRAAGGRNEEVCEVAQCHPGPELVIDDFAFSLTSERLMGAAPPSGEMIVSGAETFQPPLAAPAGAAAEVAASDVAATEIASAEVASAEKSPFVETPAAVEPQGEGEERPAAAPAASETAPAVESPLAAEAAQPPAAAGDCRAPYFGVQVGAFRGESKSRRLGSALEQRYGAAYAYRREHPDKGVLHHLIIGCSEKRGEAAALRRALAAEDTEGFVVRVSAEEFGGPSGALAETASAEETPYAQASAVPKPLVGPVWPIERRSEAAPADKSPPAGKAAPDAESSLEVETAQPPADAGDCRAPYFGVQVGAFAKERKARLLASALGRRHGAAYAYRREHPDKGALHHLVIGCAEERGEAAALRRALAAEGAAGFVVRVTADVFGEPL